MPKIEKLPSGSFRMRITIGTTKEGKVVRKSITATTRKELKAKAAVYMSEHKAPLNEVTVQKATDAFIESCTATLSPSTVRGYIICQKAWNSYPKLMHMRVSEVTKRDVQEAIDDMCLAKTSPKTVRNRFSFLSASLKRYDIRIEVRLPSKKRPDIYVPGDDIVRNVFEAAKGTDLEIPIMLAAIGGMRRGEICALTMDDINGSVIHVSKDMIMDREANWIVKDIPKTLTSNRFVEMPQYVIDLIQAQGYVTRFDPQYLTIKHRTFLKRNGFPHFRIHDYRHHMVSALHAAGVPDAYIMQRGGWSSDYTMKNVYRHTLADHEAEAVQATLAHFDSLLGEN